MKILKKILFTLYLISLFSAEGQIGMQLTTLHPASDIKNEINTGYGIELGYYSSEQDDNQINFYSFGYRIYNSKNINNLDQYGKPILSSYYKYEDFREFFLGSYYDVRIFDEHISPIFGIGANLTLNTFKITNYTNNIATSSNENTDIGFLIIPRVGVVYDLSYYFTFTAGLSYTLRINYPNESVDRYWNPFIGIAFYLD